MTDLVINMTSENQVEGLRVDHELVETIWPEATPAQVVAGMREYVEIALFNALVLSGGQSLEGAANLVDRKTSSVG